MPKQQDYIFAFKAFAASLLALYIAFEAGLAKPSWAMVTSLIVAQPFAGMVVSKALYRLGGTFIGAIASVTILTAFGGAPVTQMAALSGWVGLCVFLSGLDKTPRAYAFVLSGYTAAIIAFPTVEAPQSVFDAALARCEEISLGILCATLVHAVVFPRRVGPVLGAGVSQWFDDAARWIEDLLIHPDDTSGKATDRRKLIADAMALDRLRVHALYDSPLFRERVAIFDHLRECMQMIASYLLAIDDRLTILRAERPDLLDELRGLRGEFTAWFRAATPDDLRIVEANHLRDRLSRMAPTGDELREGRHVLLYAALLLRLADLMTSWQESLATRADFLAARRGRARPARQRLHVDPVMSAISGATAAAVLMVIGMFWMLSAWPDGVLAALMVAVACSLGASFDDPAGFVINFLIGMMVGICIAAIYLFGILPHVTTMEGLILVLAPFYLGFGVMLSMPSTAPFVFPLLLGATVNLGIENQMTYDFAVYANGALAQVLGLAVAAAGLSIARASGSDVAISRIVVLIHRDLGRLLERDRDLTQAHFVSLMHDRVDGLMQRRAADPERADMMIDGALAALRVAHNLQQLRHERQNLEPVAQVALEAVRAQLGRHFSAANAKKDATFDASIAAINNAMTCVSLSEAEEANATLILLGQIRHILARHDAFFRTPSVSRLSRARAWVQGHAEGAAA